MYTISKKEAKFDYESTVKFSFNFLKVSVIDKLAESRQ